MDNTWGTVYYWEIIYMITMSNILRSDTSDEMTFFQLSFFEIGGKFEWFCLIWGIYGKCATLLYSFFHYSRVYSNKKRKLLRFYIWLLENRRHRKVVNLTPRFALNLLPRMKHQQEDEGNKRFFGGWCLLHAPYISTENRNTRCRVFLSLIRWHKCFCLVHYFKLFSSFINHLGQTLQFRCCGVWHVMQ